MNPFDHVVPMRKEELHHVPAAHIVMSMAAFTSIEMVTFTLALTSIWSPLRISRTVPKSLRNGWPKSKKKWVRTIETIAPTRLSDHNLA